MSSDFPAANPPMLTGQNRAVPRVPDEFLESVVYLYRSRAEAEASAKDGASGFVVAVPGSEEGNAFHYVVTNRHVARNAGAVRINADSGATLITEINDSAWHFHPDGDDLAVWPLPVHGTARYKAIPTSFFLSRAEMSAINVGAGDEVFFIGRFQAHAGRARNSPVVGFGHLAKGNTEPVRHATFDIDQESFLIEARSLSGFSGSPVFLFVPPFSPRFLSGSFGPDERGLSTEVHTGLLGIDWGHFDLDGEEVSSATRVSSGMMAAVPVWKLRELLECDELVGWRAEQEQRLTAAPIQQP